MLFLLGEFISVSWFCRLNRHHDDGICVIVCSYCLLEPLAVRVDPLEALVSFFSRNVFSGRPRSLLDGRKKEIKKGERNRTMFAHFEVLYTAPA